MHLHFELEDPRWAIVIAGALYSAKTGMYKEMNPNFTVSFSRTNPLIAHIADSFHAKPANAIPYTLPSPDQYPILDYFQAANHARDLFNQHGIKQDPMVVPLYLHMLVSNSLLMTHNIANKAGYFLPKFSPAQTAKAPNSDIIIEAEAYRQLATIFAKGLGVENPTIICAQDYNDFEIAAAVVKTRAIVSDPTHFLQYVVRSQYTGYDNIQDTVPAVCVIDGSFTNENRYLLSWNGQVPVTLGEPEFSINDKARGWRIKASYNFNHREFLKDNAKGEVKIR